MNNLLNKFENIEIKPIDKITEEDRAFCEAQYRVYKNSHNTYKEILEKLNSAYDFQNRESQNLKDNNINDHNSSIRYIDTYGKCGIDDTKDMIVEMTGYFISHIIYYFSQKYQIELNQKYKHENKYDGFNKYHDSPDKLNAITLEDVLEKYLFPQLNGFTFQELAVKQIKDKAKTPLYYNEYRKYWNYEVKGKTIKFKMNISDIKPALYYYDSGETKIIDCYMYQRVSDYKHYDNGNTDIKFISAEYALDFAKRYLGYIEMTEEEREEYKNKSRW